MGQVEKRHWLLISSRLRRGTTVRLLLGCTVLTVHLTGTLLAADPAPPTQQQAMALLRDGKRQEALRAFVAIIASKPADPTAALFNAAEIDLEDGDWRAARPFAEQLVKLRPASFTAWELMIQVDQAAGDLADRDAAIQSLYEAWRSALDPQIQARMSFIRDRITGPKQTLIAHETLEPSGENILRFLFQPADEVGSVHHLIVVRSDNETNDRWREDGTVPYGTLVYHLDTVEQRANGQTTARPYEFYLEPPDYDRVRDKVVQILAGTLKPLNGQADPFWSGEPAK